MLHFTMGWNCSAHFISQWAGIDQPIFHFAVDHHAIIADMDHSFIAASDFIAASRASPKCKSLLITLNPVGMLCLDQPIAPNLPPLLLSNICSPRPSLNSIGSLVAPAEAADATAAATAAAAAAARAAAARAAAVAPSACNCYGPGVVAAAGPGVVTLRRRVPTCRAAPSPGLYKPAASTGCTCQWRRGNINTVACVEAIQQLHASRTSQNQIKSPTG
jgi:hypothetical protein